MSDDEEQTPARTPLDDESEKEMEELYKALRKVSAKDRRTTLRGLRVSLDKDVTPPTVGTSRAGEDVVDSLARRITIDNSSRKIKNFSGSEQRAPGEVDYIHWRRAAIQIAQDPELTENKKHVLILQSLAGEAEDNVELVRDKPTIEIIEFLDSFYGTISDEHDLMAIFFQLNQEPKQTASEYFTILYRKLTVMVKKELVTEDGLGKMLIKQFSRGLSDDSLVTRLRLDELASNPPEFTVLLAKIRKHEMDSTARKERVSKQARSREVNVEQEEKEKPTKSKNELDQLKERLTELESVAMASQQSPQEQVKRSPPFCYRCGIDGHMAYDCVNTPNKDLVSQKREQRRQMYHSSPKNLPDLRLRAKTRR